MLLFDLRQGWRFFLAAIYTYRSARNPAHGQVTAIIGKEYFSHFVSAIIPTFEDSQLLAETLGGRASTRFQRFHGGTDAATEGLG